jgi:hypothetical protein
MDPNLNFKTHINHISKKISSRLYFIRTAKNYLTIRSLKFLYYLLIHCHLIYAIHIWSCTAQSNLKCLINQQKAAVRLISSSSYNAHTESIFKRLHILPFCDLMYFFKLQFMQHFKQGFLPNAFKDEWTSIAARFDDPAINHMELRNLNLDNFEIPFERLSTTEQFPLTSFPRAWNSFEDFEIKTIHNKLDFNVKLNNYLLDKLNANYRCTRLLCPHCHFN